METPLVGVPTYSKLPGTDKPLTDAEAEAEANADAETQAALGYRTGTRTLQSIARFLPASRKQMPMSSCGTYWLPEIEYG
jgi:hypothetical protein